jgi:transposase
MEVPNLLAKEGAMAALSMDLRARIFEARQAGESTAEVAERFAVSPAFVRRLLQRHRESGSLAPNSARRGPRPSLEGQLDRIRAFQAQHPDRTPAEIRAQLGLPVSPLTVWRVLRRLGLTRKKSRSGRPSSGAPTSARHATGGQPRSPPRPRAG